MNITAERLREVLDYDSESGVFRHRLSGRGHPKPGTIAGTPNGKGYLQIMVDGRRYLAHILAWLYETGELPVEKLDHRDRRRDHNAFENLRPATRSQNQANSKIYVTNTSGRKGVRKTPGGRHRATIHKDGRSFELGTFDTVELAHEAYLNAAERLFGEFATGA